MIASSRLARLAVVAQLAVPLLIIAALTLHGILSRMPDWFVLGPTCWPTRLSDEWRARLFPKRFSHQQLTAIDESLRHLRAQPEADRLFAERIEVVQAGVDSSVARLQLANPALRPTAAQAESAVLVTQASAVRESALTLEIDASGLLGWPGWRSANPMWPHR